MWCGVWCVPSVVCVVHVSGLFGVCGVSVWVCDFPFVCAVCAQCEVCMVCVMCVLCGVWWCVSAACMLCGEWCG